MFSPIRLVAYALTVAVMASVVPVKGQSSSRAPRGYLIPPDPIPGIVDAPFAPTMQVAPDGGTLLLSYRPPSPPISELSAPWIGLAGIRVNPRNNGLRVTSRATALVLVDVATGSERKLVLPAEGTFAGAFSPDGQKVAITHITPSAIRLLVADARSGNIRTLVDQGVNLAAGECAWRNDSTGLLCFLVPEDRGPVPVRPNTPEGPTIKESTDKRANWTYGDVLADAHDERLFDYYLTSQLAWVDLSGRTTVIGKPAVFEAMSSEPAARSADDRHLVVTILKKPYPYELRSTAFPRDIELWTHEGKVIRGLAHQPTTTHRVPLPGAAIVEPRTFLWHTSDPNQLSWVEALDKGDPRVDVPHRDRIVALTAPFTGESSEVHRLEWRYYGRWFTERGDLIVGDHNRQTRVTRFWLASQRPAKKLWEIGDAAGPAAMGIPFFNPGSTEILQDGEDIYFEGERATQQGNRPLLARFNLKSLSYRTVWQSSEDATESVVAVLNWDANRLVIRRESRTLPQNLFLYDAATSASRAITRVPDPHPSLSEVQKRLLTYKRKDGVQLLGTLYLPAGYREGQRLPTVLWTYPREYTSADAAGQVDVAPNTFTRFGPAHPLLLVTQGYALFFQPSIPIVGPGETANDTYVEQLVAGAEAAVNRVVELGIADPDRMAIGGHSYGAFTAANLLAHTNLFRAGVARSGLYNLTLNPAGFQSERRMFWQVPQTYLRMSPLVNADKVDEPLLLIHGGADENPNTPPAQSEAFYMALRNLGKTVRHVTLPHEGHNYTARESHLHTIAETLAWFDRYVKNATPRAAVR